MIDQWYAKAVVCAPPWLQQITDYVPKTILDKQKMTFNTTIPHVRGRRGQSYVSGGKHSRRRLKETKYGPAS